LKKQTATQGKAIYPKASKLVCGTPGFLRLIVTPNRATSLTKKVPLL